MGRRSLARMAPRRALWCPIFTFGRAPNGSRAFASRPTTTRATGRRAATTTTPTRGRKSVMAEGTPGRIKWRLLLRAVHRDVGYTAVGLTFVYALSGLAVNHVADWDPNFENTTATHELGRPLPEADDQARRLVIDTLGIRDTPKEVYREGDAFELLFEHRTLHVTSATGH